jgi:hypothetical protein
MFKKNYEMIFISFYQAANLSYIFVIQNLLRLILIRKKNKSLLLSFVFLFFGLYSAENVLQAQTGKSDIVCIHGVLMSSDTILPVADAQIFSRDNVLGSFSDTCGRFTITVARNDSIMFASVGYITTILAVTDSLLQRPEPDTFYLPLDTVLIHEVIIHGYWDYETFKQMLIHMMPAKSSYDVTEDMKKRPLLYKEREGHLYLFSPIQTLYDLLNKKAVIQRRLIHNRKMYNRKMIKLGRLQDTIPVKLDYMKDKLRN